MDEYINMTYNNHVGTLLGVSRGSDHRKACGNDYTNNTEHDKYPHFNLNETIWFNSWTSEKKDYKTLKEMILPIKIFDEGDWECRTKNNFTKIEPTNQC